MNWLTLVLCSFQISVVADVLALPTFLSNALDTAKGSKN